MNPIALSDFQLISSKYGKEKGQAYFDPNESLTHDIFSDRIVFYTNFLDHSSYEAYIHEEVLCLKKTRLDNYELHLKATIIADEMEEDDWEELAQLWSQMVKDLITVPILSDQDIRTELTGLFSYLFTESEAETFAQKLPKKKKPNQGWIWEQISAALENTNRSVSFEWKEWADLGVMEVNTLGPVVEAGIEIPYPGKKEIQDVNKASDWERAILQYFNAHLDASDLKLMAIGTHFDEYQMFACLHMRDLSLVNALEKLTKLGIIYKY